MFRKEKKWLIRSQWHTFHVPGIVDEEQAVDHGGEEWLGEENVQLVVTGEDEKNYEEVQ